MKDDPRTNRSVLHTCHEPRHQVVEHPGDSPCDVANSPMRAATIEVAHTAVLVEEAVVSLDRAVDHFEQRMANFLAVPVKQDGGCRDDGDSCDSQAAGAHGSLTRAYESNRRLLRAIAHMTQLEARVLELSRLAQP